MCKCVCVCVRVHSERNKLRNLMCVCVCVRRQTQKGNTERRHNIESTRRCGGVFVCGTPCRRDGSSGKRVNFVGQRRKRKFPAARVCVSLSPPPPPSYIPMCTHTDAQAVVALSTSFPARSLHPMKIHTYVGTRIATVILPQQFPRCTRSQSARTHTAV